MDANSPTVSVIISTFDRAELLRTRTLPLLLAQTYSNIEILIVGDATDQTSASLLEEVHDPRVRFLNLAKRGKYPQRLPERWFVAGSKPMNVGLRKASGSWICRIDDDDSPLPTFVERSLRYCLDNDLEFISASYEVFDVDGKKVKRIDPPDCDFSIGGHATWFYRAYLKSIHYSRYSWMKSFNRPTDIDRAQRIARYPIRRGIFEEVTMELHPRPGNTTTGLTQHFQEDGRAVIQGPD